MSEALGRDLDSCSHAHTLVMEKFKERSVDKVIEWLRGEDFSDTIVESFRSMLLHAAVNCSWCISLIIIGNEIDGCAFSSLTESMMKDLVPSVGPRSKLLAKHRFLQESDKKV